MLPSQIPAYGKLLYTKNADGSVSPVSGGLPTQSAPLTLTEVAGSPFTLTGAWTKVATVTADTRALQLFANIAADDYDIQWVAVPAGNATPTDTFGAPIGAAETFPQGVPTGDIYCRSPGGNQVKVMEG